MSGETPEERLLKMREANILFGAIIKWFAEVGVTFDESLFDTMGFNEGINDEYIQQIDDGVIERVTFLLEEMPEQMDIYYQYYGAFCGYFKESPPERDEELYKVIVVTFLSVTAIMRRSFKLGIAGMKSIGIIDESARVIIKAAIDANNFVKK